ncbi:hypothetical protein O3M35_009302 [Rhynocoris fuscipes]|uniref:DM10 domain-containing protein n=1 Tax=Rhynocoris fuscipes TaxID=488301 RepID=A0AAW1D8E0_9HEMI
MACPSKELTNRDKLGLIAEWMDPRAGLLRKFLFFFYPYDSTVEMYDMKNNKKFLRRTKIENLDSGDIFIGNVISVFSRQLKIVDYANILTRRLMSQKMMKVFALIKPDGFNRKAEILKILINNGFKIANLRMLKFTEPVVRQLLEKQGSSSNFLAQVAHLQSGPSIVLELVGENALEKLKKVGGPKDPNVAREEEPESIIAKMGGDEVQSAFYYSSCLEHSVEETKLMFEDPKIMRDPLLHTVVLEDSTCCVVKPHVMKEGTFGKVLSDIEDKGYKITAMQLFYLDIAKAEEFYEIYKGILLEFTDMVQELISGPCVAMELTSEHGKDTVLQFRTFVGPTDFDIARKLRPNTLRAKYGKDRIRNVVHATDLPTDGVLEVEYFFKILV